MVDVLDCISTSTQVRRDNYIQEQMSLRDKLDLEKQLKKKNKPTFAKQARRAERLADLEKRLLPAIR